MSISGNTGALLHIEALNKACISPDDDYALSPLGNAEVGCIDLIYFDFCNALVQLGLCHLKKSALIQIENPTNILKYKAIRLDCPDDSGVGLE